MNNPDSLEVLLANFFPRQGRLQVPMAKHPEPKEWQGHRLREENSPDERWHIGKGIAYTSNDEVLERRCPLNKRSPLVKGSKISFSDELEWQSDRCDHYMRSSLKPLREKCSDLDMGELQ
jgi:hypothetical protein